MNGQISGVDWRPVGVCVCVTCVCLWSPLQSHVTTVSDAWLAAWKQVGPGVGVDPMAVADCVHDVMCASSYLTAGS